MIMPIAARACDMIIQIGQVTSDCTIRIGSLAAQAFQLMK